MPDINLKNACALLRHAYFNLSHTQKARIFDDKYDDEIKRLKDFCQKISRQQIKNQEERLFLIQFQFVVWEHDDYDKPSKNELLKIQSELLSLQSLIVSAPEKVISVSSKSSKWQEIQHTAKSLMENISGIKNTSSVPQVLLEKLLKQVRSQLRKIEEEHSKGESETLEKLLGSSRVMDLDLLVNSLGTFFKACPATQEDSKDPYLNALQFQLEILTLEELIQLRKKMRSKPFISLVNACYTQSYIKNNAILFQNNADSDAQLLLSTGIEALTEKGMEKTQARDVFLQGATHIHGLFFKFYSIVQQEIEMRTNKKTKKPFPFLMSWPRKSDATPMVVAISEDERKIIANGVQCLFEPKKTDKNRLYSINMSVDRTSESPEKLNQCFGEMLQAFGTFFNPAKLVDSLYVFQKDPVGLREKISQMKDKNVDKLYQYFNGEDLNHWMSLLYQIKNGDQKEYANFCQWLSIERQLPVSKFNDKLLKLVDDLYCDANNLMQCVRSEIVKRKAEPDAHSYFKNKMDEYPEDYIYKHLNVSEKSVLTHKNAAFMKLWLKRDYPEPRDYKMELTWRDKIYHWIYPISNKPSVAPESRYYLSGVLASLDA